MLATACVPQPAPRAGRARLGYSAAAFRRQELLERRFRAGISVERMSAFHTAITGRPHRAGSEGAAAVADTLQRLLHAAGLQVELHSYSVYLSWPKEISVELVAPARQALRVTEPASPLDPDTRHPELEPGFVAYSASGDVTAGIVYVNYGLPDDYAHLERLGVDVRGRLVIARYGRSHRAVKVHTAQQQGALGLLIYSDPADDGFVRGEVWPNGYWRTAEQLQRGNAKFSWFWHGDALTPGTGAVADAQRLDPAQAPTLPRIPVAVLSYGEARKVLEQLGGTAVPQGFQGALPFTYHLGNDSVRVRLNVQMEAGQRTIRNVIAYVPGTRIERGVLLGTHHDAWTFGGVDPGTGAAALLELARGLGALRRAGWQPARTITIAFWDAEEYGLIGSTEYAEQREQTLREQTIAYINTDLYTNGRLDAGGSPSLRDFLIDVAKDVPTSRGTLYDEWRADEWARQPADRKARGIQDFEVQLKALGSGADFVPFQDYLGLPTLSIEFNAMGGYAYGPYHSNYDTRFFVERVADPGFRRGAELVSVLGTVALRLAQAEVLPFRFSHYADRLREYVTAASGWLNAGSAQTNFALDLAPLQDAVARIAEQVATLERRIDEGLSTRRLPSAASPQLDDLLARLEQRLLDESEPAHARWYRHVVYGWNIYSLYDGQPFPGLAEAIRLRDPARARREVERIGTALERLRDGLAAATALADAREP
ncbi:MAG: M28 family peptidase [Longimicrobiales bacterium]